MRAVVLTVWTFWLWSLALAQLPPGTPECAIPCYVKSVAASPCLANTTCLCTDQTFLSSIDTCVRSSCIIEDVLLVKNSSSTSCGVVPHDVSSMYNNISTILTIITVVLVIIRLACRQFLTGLGLGPDDWTIVIVGASFIPATVLNSRMADNGIGRDIWTLTPLQITTFSQTFWIITLLYFLEVALLKASILLFFLRIFPDPKFRRTVWVTVAVVAMYGVAFVFAALFQCWPISYNWTSWNDTTGAGRCTDSAAIAWANAGTGIALDLWMLYLPISQIAVLNMDVKRKFGIGAMFVVGTFVTIVSVIRLASLLQFRSSDNLTFDYAGVSSWSTVEVSVGVICACMPSIRLLLMRIWPKVFVWTTHAKSSVLSYGHGKSNNNNSSVQTGSYFRDSSRLSIFKHLGNHGRGASGNNFSTSVSADRPGRLERIDSYGDEVELRPVQPDDDGAGWSGQNAGGPHPPRDKDDKVIRVTTSVNVRY